MNGDTCCVQDLIVLFDCEALDIGLKLHALCTSSDRHFYALKNHMKSSKSEGAALINIFVSLCYF